MPPLSRPCTSAPTVAIGEAMPALHVAGRTVHGLFEMRANASPDNVALLDGNSGSTMTCRELMDAIDAVVSDLLAFGVEYGDIVALFMPPSWCFAVSTLAVNKAGAVWLPLDISSPTARRSCILETAGVCLVLSTDRKFSESASMPLWFLDKQGNVLNRSPLLHPKLPRGASRDLQGGAVFYTSGSTGQPKGVAYGRDTLLHGTLTFAKLTDCCSCVSLVKAPPVWAVIEYELFPALISGGIAVTDAQCQHSFARMVKTISRYDVSVLVTTAPVLRVLVDHYWKCDDGDASPSSLQHVVNCGSALPLGVCNDVLQKVGPQLKIYNLYGCTESPCTQWTFEPSMCGCAAPSELAPAGRPQPEVEVHILDSELEPALEGEVCFGGAFLAHGYLHDPELTARRFVVNPFTHGRLYRTGDLGRWVQDPQASKTGDDLAVLQLAGRLDRQLNIRGIRVAPEEVEAVVGSVRGVREAAALLVGSGDAARLVVCVGSPVEVAVDLEARCKELLPVYMRPTSIWVMDSLPKLNNGKVDLGHLKTSFAKEGADIEEVVDMFGFTRRVEQRQKFEHQVLAASRALATFSIIWRRCCNDILSYGDDGAVASPWFAEPGCLQSLVRGCARSDWGIVALLLTCAYSDRKDGEEKLHSRWTQDLVLLLMCFATYRPIQEVIAALWYGTLHQTGWETLSLDSACHCYASLYLVCRAISHWILLPMSSRIQRRGFGTGIGANLFVGICFTCLSTAFELWVSTSSLRCQASAWWGTQLLTLYVVAWWLGLPLVAAARALPLAKASQGTGLGLPAAALFVVVSCSGLAAGASAGGLTHTCRSSLVFVSRSAATACLLLFALADTRGTWLQRTRLVEMGCNYMGALTIHAFFHCHPLGTRLTAQLSVVGIMRQHMRLAHVTMASQFWTIFSVLPLLVMIAYPGVLMLTFGRGVTYLLNRIALVLQCALQGTRA